MICITSCGNKDSKTNDEELTADFSYLRQTAYDYARRYLQLPDDNLIYQDFLLDVRARIDRLYYEVSPTHAMLFEKAFTDSAGVEPKI